MEVNETICARLSGVLRLYERTPAGLLRGALLGLAIVALVLVAATIGACSVSRRRLPRWIIAILLAVPPLVVVAYFVLDERRSDMSLYEYAKDDGLDARIKKCAELTKTDMQRPREPIDGRQTLQSGRNGWEGLGVLLCAFAVAVFGVRVALLHCVGEVEMAVTATGRRLPAVRRRVRDVTAVLDEVRVEGPVDGETCAICLDECEVGVVSKLRCAHVYHENCIGKWMAVGVAGLECPVCKAPIVQDDDDDKREEIIMESDEGNVV